MRSAHTLRERLVDVGVELVLREGPSSLGLREIARQAGVSHGAPRRYFPTHRGLLSAIARRGFGELGTRVTEVIDETASPRAQLTAFARVYLQYALERPGMFELMFRHDLLRGEASEAGDPQLRDSSLPLFGRLVDLVVRHRRRHGLHGREVAAEVTAIALWTNLHGLAQLAGSGALALVSGDDVHGRDSAGVDERLLDAVLGAHLGEDL